MSWHGSTGTHYLKSTIRYGRPLFPCSNKKPIRGTKKTTCGLTPIWGGPNHNPQHCFITRFSKHLQTGRWVHFIDNSLNWAGTLSRVQNHGSKSQWNIKGVIPCVRLKNLFFFINCICCDVATFRSHKNGFPSFIRCIKVDFAFSKNFWLDSAIFLEIFTSPLNCELCWIYCSYCLLSY